MLKPIRKLTAYPMRCYIGLDPGTGGAGVALYPDGLPFVEAATGKIIQSRFDKDSPQQTSDWFHRVVNFARSMEWEVVAALEKVHSSPDMGVASAFTFGRGYGRLEGLLAGAVIRYEEPSPQTWQKALGCLGGGNKIKSGDKDSFTKRPGKKKAHKERAHRRWPTFADQIINVNADALLIAEWLRLNTK